MALLPGATGNPEKIQTPSKYDSFMTILTVKSCFTCTRYVTYQINVYVNSIINDSSTANKANSLSFEPK